MVRARAFAQARHPLAFAACLVLVVCGCRGSSPGDAPPAREAGTATPATASLRALRVTSSRDPSLLLAPAFSPDVHDYSIACAAGSNALQISWTAAIGAEAAILQPARSASATERTVALEVREGQAIVVGASADGSTVETWIRCLPHDFPGITLRSYPDAGAPPPGYYLLGTMVANVGSAAYAMVLDSRGAPVWFDRASIGVYDTDTIEPGVISFQAASFTRSFEQHRLSPLATTYVRAAGQEIDSHELRRLPNGNYVVILSPTLGGVDLTGLVLPLATGGVATLGANGSITQCIIAEVDAAGDVLWQWAATDHFDPVKDMTYIFPYFVAAGQPLIVEPFHCNSVDVDALGNLLVSARHMDSVFYIERSSGKVLWKMGGSAYSKDDAVYVPVADPFRRQHDARFQSDWQPRCGGAGGSGGISVFDDETETSSPARGVVYDVAVEAPGCDDGGVSHATVRREYVGTAQVPAAGSFRVLPGGRAIVGWGTTPGVSFTEIDARGHALLDVGFSDSTFSYRAIKVPLTAFDLDVLRRTAGLDGEIDGGG